LEAVKVPALTAEEKQFQVEYGKGARLVTKTECPIVNKTVIGPGWNESASIVDFFNGSNAT
jgi:hypothetical protein